MRDLGISNFSIINYTACVITDSYQEPITWSLHLPYKPLESTLSDEKLFIEIAFAEYFSRLLSNIQSEQSYDHTSHAESQKRDFKLLPTMAVASVEESSVDSSDLLSG